MANDSFGGDRTKSNEVPGHNGPASCPSCTSADIVSTAKIPDANSYWRCSNCGEVWNPGRRRMMQPAERWRR
jgi:predicted Zn finger-like uncharacterized protein